MDAPVFSAKYTLTRDEIRQVLMAAARRPGKVRMAVQTGLLTLTAAGSFILYAIQGFDDPSILPLGVISLVIIAIMWVVPEIYFRYEAGCIDRDKKPVCLSVYDDRVEFGGQLTAEVSRCILLQTRDMLIIRVGTDSIGIPHRVCSESEREALTHLRWHLR